MENPVVDAAASIARPPEFVTAKKRKENNGMRLVKVPKKKAAGMARRLELLSFAIKIKIGESAVWGCGVFLY